MTPAPSPAAETRLDLPQLLRRLQRMAALADGLLPPATRPNDNRDQ